MPSRHLAVGRVTAEYFQTPHPTPDLDPAAAVLRAIDSAEHLLIFAVYSFTHPDLAAAVLRAHARGVTISGVVDATQMHGATSKVPDLVRAGVSLRSWGGPFRLMHDKALTVDNKTAGLGSFNWTTQAEKNNIEVLLITHSRPGNRLVNALSQQMLTVFNEGAAIVA